MVSMEFVTFPFSCERIKRTHSDATYSDIYTSSKQMGIWPLLHVLLRPGNPFATFSFGTRSATRPGIKGQKDLGQAVDPRSSRGPHSLAVASA